MELFLFREILRRSWAAFCQGFDIGFFELAFLLVVKIRTFGVLSSEVY
jgi:hypothetical protein